MDPMIEREILRSMFRHQAGKAPLVGRTTRKVRKRFWRRFRRWVNRCCLVSVLGRSNYVLFKWAWNRNKIRMIRLFLQRVSAPLRMIHNYPEIGRKALMVDLLPDPPGFQSYE